HYTPPEHVLPRRTIPPGSRTAVTPFFSRAPAPTEIYTLSLHDALPIFGGGRQRPLDSRQAREDGPGGGRRQAAHRPADRPPFPGDRKSTRLNSSHVAISYAVFCLKKKKDDITSTVPFQCMSDVMLVSSF